MPDRTYPAAVLESSASVRAADPRRGILDALVHTVALRGYDRTTLDRVLLQAKVPAPVFDEHFEDKQDCLLAALDELVATLEDRLLSRIASATCTCWSERVHVGLETLLTELADHPDEARVALVECLGAGEPAIARMRLAIAKAVAALERGRDGEDDGERSAPDTEHLPPQTSEAVVGGIASILHRRVLGGHTEDLPTLLPDLLYFALMPYLGHERALTISESARPALA